MSNCCLNGIYPPLIIDPCTGQTRPLRSNEALIINGQVLSAGGGGGDGGGEGGGFITPGSTDNAIVRADGTSNDTVQGSTTTISDAGAITINQDSSLETSGSHLPALVIRDSSAAVSVEIMAFDGTSNNLAIGTNSGANITTGTNNTLIGDNAGAGLTEGSDNMLLGRVAGIAITTGIRNIAIGASALTSCITGSSNTAIGRASLNSATGSSNTAIGLDAGRAITTGANNVFIGVDAGDTGQTATVSNCVAIGVGAVTAASGAIAIGLNAVGESSEGVFIGDGAGASMTAVGIDVIAIGPDAAASADIDNGSVCIGSDAGQSAEFGVSVVCIGRDTGESATVGDNTVLLGPGAGGSTTSVGSNCFLMGSLAGALAGDIGNFCVAIGQNALRGVDCGTSNFALGREAGRSLSSTSANDNIFIGSFAGNNASQKTDADNSIAIGASAFTELDDQIVLGTTSHLQTVLRGEINHTNDAATYSRRVYTLQRRTTSASLLNLLTADGSGNIEVPENSTIAYRALISAIRDDGSEGAAYEITGAARRDGSAAPVAVGSLSNLTVIGEDDATWTAAAGVTGNNLKIDVQGASGKNIQWSAIWELIQAIE